MNIFDEMIIRIKIKDSLPSTISTRKVITEYCQKISFSSNNVYSLDFSDISFISRSCADEFVRTFASKSIKWEFNHANRNIKSMFDAVLKTQQNIKHDYDIVAITPFLNKPELSQFLAAI
jgi:hypothetical protein